jgi:hypothetical protein
VAAAELGVGATVEPALLAHGCDARSAFPSITNRLAATRHGDCGPAGQAGAPTVAVPLRWAVRQAAAARLGAGAGRLREGSIMMPSSESDAAANHDEPSDGGLGKNSEA